jgi:hypothetical protein
MKLECWADIPSVTHRQVTPVMLLLLMIGRSKVTRRGWGGHQSRVFYIDLYENGAISICNICNVCKWIEGQTFTSIAGFQRQE